MRDADNRELFEITLAKVTNPEIHKADRYALFEFFVLARRSRTKELAPRTRVVRQPLDDRDLEILRLRSQGMSYTDTARAVGVSRSRGVQLYKNAMARLRKLDDEVLIRLTGAPKAFWDRFQ